MQPHSDFDFDDVFTTAEPDARSLSASNDSLHNSRSGSLCEPSVVIPLPEPDAQGEFRVNFDDAEGRKLGYADFSLLRLLGKGAFGKVFLVRPTGEEGGQLYAMKVLAKGFLVRTNNVFYTRTERNVLKRVRHPFVCSLHYAFQTHGKLYLVMDYAEGGQLFFHLRREQMLSEVHVRFYAAEIVLALEHLHANGIVHRDLKPENILLTGAGHILVTDFGLSKEDMPAGARTKTFCGTIEYMAPEMIKGGLYGKDVDWWSFGILVFDMLTGNPPFRHKNDNMLKKKILTEKVKLPTYLTAEAASLIKGLLQREPALRLGANDVPARCIRQHRFFQKLSWAKFEAQEIPPPFVPPQADDATRPINFDVVHVNAPVVDSPTDHVLSSSQEKLFLGFSYARSWEPPPSRFGHNGEEDGDEDGDDYYEEDDGEEAVEELAAAGADV